MKSIIVCIVLSCFIFSFQSAECDDVTATLTESYNLLLGIGLFSQPLPQSLLRNAVLVGSFTCNMTTASTDPFVRNYSDGTNTLSVNYTSSVNTVQGGNVINEANGYVLSGFGLEGANVVRSFTTLADLTACDTPDGLESQNSIVATFVISKFVFLSWSIGLYGGHFDAAFEPGMHYG